MNEVQKIEDQEIDFEEILKNDIHGWMSFFDHPKIPEFIAYIQALHGHHLRRFLNNKLITDEDVRKALQSKGTASILLRLQGVLIEAKEGLNSQRQPKSQ